MKLYKIKKLCNLHDFYEYNFYMIYINIIYIKNREEQI